MSAGFLYGTTTPYASGVAIFLMIFLCFFGSYFTIQTWMNRNHPIMKVRISFFQMFAQICIMFWGVLVALQIPLATIYPCFLSSTAIFIFALFLGPFYIMRTFKLYFAFHLTQSQVEFSKMKSHTSQLDWFVNNKKWASTKYMYYILSILLFINALPLILISLLNPNFMFHHTYSEKCSVDALYFIILTLFYLFGISFFTYKIWNIEDNLFIKKEFTLTSIVAGVGLVPWATIGRLTVIQNFQTDVFPIVSIWSVLCCMGLLSCLTYPLYKIYNLPIQEKGDNKQDENALEELIGFESFQKFLEHEFAVECLFFWKKCKEYRQLCESEDNLKTHVFAVDMIRNFLSRGSPLELNISGRVFSSFKNKLKEMGLSTLIRPYDHEQQEEKDIEKSNLITEIKFFDRIESEVFFLMYTDSFMRYQKSEFYTPYKEYLSHRKSAQCAFDEIDKKNKK